MRRGKEAHLVEKRNGYKGCDIESLRLLAGHTTKRRAVVVDFCTVFEVHVQYMILLMRAAGIQSQLCHILN